MLRPMTPAACSPPWVTVNVHGSTADGVLLTAYPSRTGVIGLPSGIALFRLSVKSVLVSIVQQISTHRVRSDSVSNVFETTLPRVAVIQTGPITVQWVWPPTSAGCVGFQAAGSQIAPGIAGSGSTVSVTGVMWLKAEEMDASSISPS